MTSKKGGKTPRRYYRCHYTGRLVGLDEMVTVAREILADCSGLEVPTWARRALTKPGHLYNDTTSAFEVLRAAGYVAVTAYAVPDDVCRPPTIVECQIVAFPERSP